MNLTIPNDDYAICHGSSRFVKNDKLSDLKRKSKTGQVWCVDLGVLVVSEVTCVSHHPVSNLVVV